MVTSVVCNMAEDDASDMHSQQWELRFFGGGGGCSPKDGPQIPLNKNLRVMSSEVTLLSYFARTLKMGRVT